MGGVSIWAWFGEGVRPSPENFLKCFFCENRCIFVPNFYLVIKTHPVNRRKSGYPAFFWLRHWPRPRNFVLNVDGTRPRNRFRAQCAGYPVCDLVSKSYEILKTRSNVWNMRMQHFVWQSTPVQMTAPITGRPDWKRPRGRPRRTWIRRAAGGPRRAQCRCWQHGT